MTVTRNANDFSRSQPSTRLKPGSVKLLTPAEEYELVHKLGQVRTKAWKLIQPLVDKAPEDMRLDHFDQVVSLYHREGRKMKRPIRLKIDKLLREYSDIKHRLAVANLPWVTKLSRGQKQSTSIPEEDLFQEGVCGLLKAIDRFEPERGLRLMTYATWYIREAMQQIRARQSHLVSISSRSDHARADGREGQRVPAQERAGPGRQGARAVCEVEPEVRPPTPGGHAAGSEP